MIGDDSMAIDWQPVPEPSLKAPFDGDQVLLAIPNWIRDGERDPDYPYTLHLGIWDHDENRWATNELNEVTGDIRWLKPADPTFWAVVDLPF